MRPVFTLFFIICTCTLAWAQPANDECDNATPIGLNAPAACPTGGSANTVISGTNIDATPTTPYPTFTGCNPGGNTTGPAAEVWYSFIATGNTNTFTITGGLASPNIVIFTGGNCQFLTAIACASAMPGTGVVALSDLNLTPGNTYFALISGGDVNDQGDFTLTVESENDCSLCTSENGQTVTVNPPPANGTYASGTQVQFCYTLSEWDLTGTVEWFHGIQITLGAGWDEFSLQPDFANTIAPSCPANPGNWVWSTGWVGCNTSNNYGPGFAYDGTLTSTPPPCPMSPVDGDPGNNWGFGGGGCEFITPANALTFCWYVNVRDCPPNDNGSDLSIIIEPLSDGESGSWNQIGCNSGVSFDFLSSATCCDDPDPIATSTPTSCPGASNGTITYQGGAGAVSGPWNYTVFDQGGNVIYQSTSVPGQETLGNLPAGMYNVTAINAISGCSRSTFVTVDDGPPPTAIATANMPCPGNQIQLMGDVIPGGSNVQYLWTAPSGATYTSQNPLVTLEGEYTLEVTVDGCDAPPVTVNASYVAVNTSAQASPTQACSGDMISLSASGGTLYDWGPDGFGQTIPVIAPDVIGTQVVTYTVNITTAEGCTVTETVDVTVNQLPEAEIIAPLEACEGDIVTLNALGGTSFQWGDGQTGAVISITLGPGPVEEHVVTVTDQFGCTATDNHFINVNPPPSVTATATPDIICAGEEVVLSATGGDFYDWVGESPGQSITVTPGTSTQYEVIVTDGNGCMNNAFVSVTVEEPIDTPMVSCGPVTPNSVTFLWDPVPGAAGYDVTVDMDPAGTLSGTTYTVDGLSPGQEVTITVSAQSPNNCPDPSVQISCSAQDCLPVAVEASGIATHCLNGNNIPDTLSATITAPNEEGDTLWTGPGIIDTLLGIFDPAVADTGTHEIILTYTEGECAFTDTLSIEVYQTPAADFVFDADTICINDTLLVSYTGTADTAATYNWNFNGGTAVPGTGQGPQQVSWSNSGEKIVSLTVVENGCPSPIYTDTVSVLNPLSPPVVSCGNSTTTSVLFTWNEITGASGYTVDVLTGQSGTLDSTTFLVDNLMPEDAVTIVVTAIDAGPCGDVSTEFTCLADPCPSFAITFGNVLDICLDSNTQTDTLNANVNGGSDDGEGIWSGPGIVDDTLGIFDPAVAGAGTHTIIYDYTEGPCSASDSLDITVYDTPTPNFIISETEACIGDTVIITYTGTADTSANYSWNFNGGNASPGTGPGPHEVSWPSPGIKTVSLTVEENNCFSEQFTQTIDISSPLAPPVINCNTTTSSIEFSWNDVTGAVAYVVTVLQGPAGIQMGNTYLITGLDPGDISEIQVEAVGDGPCGSSFASTSCVAEDCPTVEVSIDSVPPICLDATAIPIDLSVSLTGDNGTGTGSWMGNGITDMVQGTFDPDTSGVGIHTITYTYQEGNCSYSGSREIIVNEQPTATFTVEDSICIDQSGTITYTGSAGPGASYNWSFDGGNATPGTGAGPQEISWTSGGSKAITLEVTENGCTSELFEQNVFVDTLLPAPVISCNTTTSSIEFSWNDVPGAVSYNVTVLQGPGGTQSGNTYLVTGLDPEEMVEIEVEAVGTGPCGNSSASLSCVANNCPMVAVSIDSVAPVCLDASAIPITLTTTLSGDNGMGAGSWSGPGITDTVQGIFNPDSSGIGNHTITYLYQEDNCSYTATRVIVVNEQPTADFMVTDSICINQSSTLTYTGTAGINADYNWDFSGGNAIPGTGAGPHEVSWNSGGDKIISLVVSENDCASEAVEQTVFVDTLLNELIISCETDNTSITFSWDPIPGADGYQVIDVSGPTGTLNGTSYSVTGLDPGDMVTIQVIAENAGPCGPSMAEQSCVAQDCPDITLEIDEVTPLCEDSDPVSLSATATGGDGSGSFTWSGTGVTGNEFDPADVPAPGNYVVSVEYVEGVCIFNGSINITVNEVPAADFTADSPVCVDSVSVISYTGTATAGATYSWDFDGGVLISGGDQSAEVSWPAAGDYTISLMVEENACASETETQLVSVEAPLAEPAITCETSSTSILFSWPAVPGAISYEVEVLQGSMGLLDGTTYLIDNLNPGDEVEIQVTAIGAGPCGNSSSTLSCIAQDCPMLTASLDGPAQICSGDNASITLEIDSDDPGPYTVVYALNGNEFTDEFPAGSSTFEVALTEATDLTIVSITNTTLEDCMYASNSALSIEVDNPQSAGIATGQVQLCAGTDSIINLSSLLEGADTGGVWTETSTTSSTGSAFNPDAGTFATVIQSAGTYRFTYTVGAGGICPSDATEVQVIIQPLPVADAGADMELTCNMGMVTLGSNNSSGASYLWSSDSVVITDPNSQFIDVGQPGTYQLSAISDFGCIATDEVMVTANLEVPIFETQVSQISCFEANDGAIILSNFSGGQPPYQVSLNGAAFSTQTEFFNLGPSNYDIVVQDANGCVAEVSLNLDQPEQVVVTLTTNLEGENVIQLGDSVLLTAVYNPNLNIDTILWQPDSIAFNSSDASSVWVSPQVTSSYSVTIANENGCSDSDNATIIVEKNRPVYIPNIFSPNEDGKNDIFYIQGGTGIVEVKAFSIYNRWGEQVFFAEQFPPNDPDFGWDGTYRGEVMNAAVFVYYAEVEFTDGEVILFKGDVTLMR